MKFSINDRISLRNALPTEANRASMTVIYDLHEQLEILDSELPQIDGSKVMKDNGSVGFVWDADKAKAYLKDIVISEVANGIICELLRKLDRENKYPPSLVKLGVRFLDQDEAGKELAEKKKQAAALKAANPDLAVKK